MKIAPSALILSLSCSMLAYTSAFVVPAAPSLTRRSSGVASKLYAILPLATEGEWTAYLDESGTGFVYYFNGQTGESLWEKPTATFPVVTLEGTLQQTATKKQEEYLKTVEEEQANKKGFFQAILDTPAERVEVDKPKEKEKKEESNWFGSLFETVFKETEEKPKEKEVVDATPKATAKAKETPTTVEPKKEEKIEVNETTKRDILGGMLNKFNSPKPAVKGDAGPTSKTAVNGEKSTATVEPKKVQEKKTIAPIIIKSASYVLPHPAKVRWGGEDAVFTKGRTFGVFDGVSGAEKLEGVPLYSKTLANEMKKLVEDDEALSIVELTKRMLKCAEIADQMATGASTAVVASIGEDGMLRALNVGDSTCIVIRNGKVAGKTREIVHYFECPYQLSVDSPDRPRDGTKMNIQLMRGDLILMASDGIFDNLSDEEVVGIVSGEQQLSLMAKRVSELSRKVSLDRKSATPYAKLAQKYGDMDYESGLGGKVDDVSCVVVSYN